MRMNDLIGGWGGFEKLVVALNETGNVLIEHNVVLLGKSSVTKTNKIYLFRKNLLVLWDGNKKVE